MAVFSSISDTGYDTVITTLGQQDLSNAVWNKVECVWKRITAAICSNVRVKREIAYQEK